MATKPCRESPVFVVPEFQPKTRLKFGEPMVFFGERISMCFLGVEG